MRIVIVGPGALGCFFSGLLSKHAEVWLLDRDPKRAERIVSNGGVFCEGISNRWQAKIPVTACPKDIGRADLVIICVKAYHTKEAIAHAKEVVQKDTCVLTLQNGLGNVEVISEIIGQENILAGITNHGLSIISEGRVSHNGTGETIIGHLDGRIPVSVRSIREILNKAGIETRVSRNIKGVLWSKLIVNVGINALSAITRLKNGQLIEFDNTAEILRGAVTEAVKVSKKKRVKLIYDDPLAKVEAVCKATSANTCSMLQDVLARRKTEVDFINGVIVRQGRSSGIPTPVNFVLLNLVKTIEGTYQVSVEKQDVG